MAGILPEALAARMSWEEIAEWHGEIDRAERERMRRLAITIGTAAAYAFGSLDKSKFEAFLEQLAPTAKAVADHKDIDQMKHAGLPIEDAV